jgi:hypothetical protein
MLLNSYSNCTVGAVIWSVAGNVSGVRMNQLCTLFLAIDRLYALFRPFAYRTKNHLKVAQTVIVISLLWGVFDIAINALGRDFNEVCAKFPFDIYAKITLSFRSRQHVLWARHMATYTKSTVSLQALF